MSVGCVSHELRRFSIPFKMRRRPFQVRVCVAGSQVLFSYRVPVPMHFSGWVGISTSRSLGFLLDPGIPTA
eukprot:1153723-Rhodomonas_salina.1